MTAAGFRTMYPPSSCLAADLDAVIARRALVRDGYNRPLPPIEDRAFLVVMARSHQPDIP